MDVNLAGEMKSSKEDTVTIKEDDAQQTTEGTHDKAEHQQKQETIVQYIVIRRDLYGESLKWPLGSVIAQGCHAATAALWMHREDEISQLYCSKENIDHMHKVVLCVKGETQLVNLSKKLTNNEVAHKLWMEQPENMPTCLATKPYVKSEVQAFFRKMNLAK